MYGNSCSYKEATDIKISNVFADHMVLQRGREINFHGEGTPNSTATAEFNGLNRKITIDRDGLWNTIFPKMEAGGPYEFKLTIKDTTLILTDILIGDVWIGSGQSNMVWKLEWDVQNSDQEIANANYDQIRFFTVGNDFSYTRKNSVENGQWVVCSPDTAGSFSAVAYFFARHLQTIENVPVGMVVAAIGGTSINGWIGDQELEESQIDHQEDTSAGSIEFNDSSWKTMELPAFIEDFEDPEFTGYAWFRKSFDLPLDEPLQIGLGKIDDEDEVWLNGHKIGQLAKYNQYRRYYVPDSIVKPRDNIIAVRVLDKSGLGGFWGVADSMYVADIDGKMLVDLSGDWKYSINILPKYPVDRIIPGIRSVMFNAMVHPFTEIPVKGVVWYQGEADEIIGEWYEAKLRTLIESWREAWKNSELPFLIVQLPNFRQHHNMPVGVHDRWPVVRQAQLNVSALNGVETIITIDLGEAGDIHPKNKQDVGYRLGLMAEQMVYNKKVVSHGPTYKNHVFRGDTAIVYFEHVSSGLEVRGDTLSGFALAGDDGQFYHAKAWVEDNTVFLNSLKINHPVAIRYGWADNPSCNLYNGEGLPTAPFKTD